MGIDSSAEYYDEKYFSWQKNIGEFGGKANTFKFIKSVGKDFTLIDYGCGGGFLLKNLDAKNKIGIELNINAHKLIKENGAEPFVSAQECQKNLGQRFADLIISNNALEHTLNPYDEIQKLYPLLKQGGKIHFIVPLDSINYKWKPNDVNNHLYSWSPMNLGKLFLESGFEVVSVKPYIHKWPPFYRRIQSIFGWKIFNLVCRIYGKIERSWFQIEIIAVKA